MNTNRNEEPIPSFPNWIKPDHQRTFQEFVPLGVDLTGDERMRYLAELEIKKASGAIPQQGLPSFP